MVYSSRSAEASFAAEGAITRAERWLLINWNSQ
jgi:hypothetical protein